MNYTIITYINFIAISIMLYFIGHNHGYVKAAQKHLQGLQKIQPIIEKCKGMLNNENRHDKRYPRKKRQKNT